MSTTTTGAARTKPVLYYLHIPKTAGITLAEEVLRPQYSTSPYREAGGGYIQAGILFYPGEPGFFKPRPPEIPEDVRAALREECVTAVIGHFSFGIHAVTPERRFTYLTTMRDPVARVWSLYRHIQAWVPDGLKIGDAGLRSSSNVGLEELYDRFALRELDNDQTRRIAGVEPVYDTCSRAMLEQAKRHLEHDFAVVGTTERLEESMHVAAEFLAWKQPLSFGRTNENPDVGYRELADTNIETLIGEHNQLDIELYEFANQLLDERLEQLRDQSPLLGTSCKSSRDVRS